jgi:hypothetical protein
MFRFSTEISQSIACFKLKQSKGNYFFARIGLEKSGGNTRVTGAIVSEISIDQLVLFLPLLFLSSDSFSKNAKISPLHSVIDFSV